MFATEAAQLRYFLNWTCNGFVLVTYLYGSRARGDHHAGSDIDLAIEVTAQPGDSNSFTTWMYWKQDYDEAPDLHLSAEVHLEWYEKDAGLERVGTGVEKDGVLLFQRFQKGD